MAFLVGGANSLTAGYDVTNGVRGVIADRPTLKRDLDTATDADKFTLSFWFKPHTSTTHSSLDSRVAQQIWCSLDGSGNAVGYLHYSDASNAQFSFYDAHSGTNPNINWSPLYRDFSAWYHIVLVGDTSQGTDTNRVKFYVNGTQVTATDSATWPDEDGDWSYANASNSHMWFDGTVGKSAWYEVQPCDSSFAELAFVDGSALTPASFGETDEDSGIWKPKQPSVTWGTNGHFMTFKQSGTGTAGTGTIGADTSGNDNHFTSDSLAAKHMITDTPTNNFATLNSIGPEAIEDYVLAEGNLKVTADNVFAIPVTILSKNGKWYAEVKVIDMDGATTNIRIGVVGENAMFSNLGGVNETYSFLGDGRTYIEGTAASYGAAIDTNDIMMVALDCDNNKIWLGINGTWLESGTVGDPAAETNHSAAIDADRFYTFAVASGSSSYCPIYEVNFGNPSFSISSSQADDNGYGNFEYDVPAGFYALCTKNLAQYG